MEHGWGGRAVDGYELGKKYDLKYVQGVEAYWVKNRFEKDKSNCHIYIGAKNERGRRAINDILSEANITGFYHRARVDIELLLSLPREDVWVTTACIAFWKYDDVDEIVLRLAEHFRENFFLELQYHNTEAQQSLNEKILKIHYDTHIPIIMACDSHYILEEQSTGRDDYLRSKEIYYEDEEGWFLDYPDGQLTYDRFAKQCVLSHDEIIEAMNNTNVFLGVEEYECACFNKDIKMVSIYPGLSQSEKDDKYEKLIWEQFQKEKPKIPEDKIDTYITEISKEVDIVKQTFHADYFLANYEIIQEGKRKGGVLTSSGRGSAVSFYTNKLLGFTEIDRIAAKVHMYPERFMSPTRILETQSLADIDFNVANPEVFAQAQIDVLGEGHSYPMIAYGTMKASGAWKMFAKASAIDFDLANKVSSQISRYEEVLKHAEEDEKEFIDVYDYIDSQFHDIYKQSLEYQGIVDSFSPHPCAYLLYMGDIRKEIGLIRIKDKICCVMDGKWAEQYHFLKNDLLKVVVVDMIDRAFRYAKQPKIDVDELLRICTPEDKVWDIYRTGCTIGVNQVEQPGTAHRVSVYQPRNIYELCSFVAAIRPGFKSMYKAFESKEQFEYGIPSLDKIIQTEEMPQSFILYQEMSMAVLNYSGIQMSECYEIIKNIAKKRVEKVLQYKQQFVEGFKEVLINDEHKSPDEAEELTLKIWQILEDSSQYSFNASHSYCVSVDSLYCAYLKAHYPLAFYAAFLEVQEEKGRKDKMSAGKQEAESYFNIKFVPYRYGQDNRSITANPEDNTLTNFITAVKTIGSRVADALYYSSLCEGQNFIDVLSILDYHKVKSSVTKKLAKIDYFEAYGNSVEIELLIDLFDEFKQGEAKSIKKTKVNDVVKNILDKYAEGNKKDGTPAVSYRLTSLHATFNVLYACEQHILSLGIEDVDLKTKMKNQEDVLGYIDLVSGKESDRRKLIVLEIFPLKGKKDKTPWAYRLVTQSIGSGKKSRITLRSKEYKRTPIMKKDVIYAEDVRKNKKGFWELYDYQVIA